MFDIAKTKKERAPRVGLCWSAQEERGNGERLTAKHHAHTCSRNSRATLITCDDLGKTGDGDDDEEEVEEEGVVMVEDSAERRLSASVAAQKGPRPLACARIASVSLGRGGEACFAVAAAQ